MGTPKCHVLIIGAGLCGLGAAIAIALEGHKVSVFESAPELHQVGAGIQITPNGLRLLRRWGIAESLRSKAAIPETLSIIRYDGQRVLAYREDYGRELETKYGESIWCLHRVDLQKAMAARAKVLGVRIIFSARVSEVDFAKATIICDGGNHEQGDLIIAADGLWSPSRSSLLGTQSIPQSTGDLAYRIVLTTDDVKESQELYDVIASPGIRIWLGPKSHAVAYSLLGGQMLNIVLLVPDDLPPDVVKAQGDLDEMVKLFDGWDPLLKKMISRARKADKWRLLSLEHKGQWASEEGTFVMAGDSCHPMLPYLAQGASLALEDGAVLGAMLGRLGSKAQIPALVRKFERLRRERIARVRNETFRQQEQFHLPDGERQEARDVLLGKSFGDPDERMSWTHPRIQPWLFGYDVYQEILEAHPDELFY